MTPTEYSGPIYDPPQPSRRQNTEGWLEYEDEPCGTCGEPLIRRYVDHRYAGREQLMRTVGSDSTRCRNGCRQ